MNKIQLWFAYFQLYNMDIVCHGFEGEKRSMNHIWINIYMFFYNASFTTSFTKLQIINELTFQGYL